METTLTRSRDNMKTKVPEIKKAIEIVSVLDKKQGKSQTHLKYWEYCKILIGMWNENYFNFQKNNPFLHGAMRI